MALRCSSAVIRPQRRGMLILLVLSMLTLFLLMGAIGLVLANRAREASRAFSIASSPSSRSQLARPLLDSALLKLVRGPAVPTKIPETLLGDRYASPQAGMLQTISAKQGTPLLQAIITGLDTTSPMTLNGRVVTFKPAANDDADATSYRIIRVAGGNTFWLANLRPTTPSATLPKRGCTAVINGREFQGASRNHDAFDTSNDFLAKVEVGSNGSITAVRSSFGAAQPSVVDNDNDGVPDGVWLSDVLPNLPAIGGGEMKSSVSYLVLDLDGRINVNCHGAPPGSTNPGMGPADVDGSALFAGNVWQLLMTGGQPMAVASVPSADQRRPAPAVGDSVSGRYGDQFNSGMANNPYALRLDLDGARKSDLVTAAGANPFTPGELERILRQFDADASSLPPRLAAILDGSAQSTRMLVTTDSWDTPGLTGGAIEEISRVADVSSLAPEVACGLRFNLNRKWNGNSVDDRRQFFRDLYSTVTAAGAPATIQTAQWVANVVAFRDNDASVAHQYQIPGGGGTVTGIEPPVHNGMHVLGQWNTGEFASTAELLAIPDVNGDQLREHLTNGTLPQLESLANARPEILEATIAPSRFAGCAINVDRQTLTDVGMQSLLDQQLSRWREPARINVNTCSPQVLKALTGVSQPTPAFSDVPAKTLLDVLKRIFTDSDRKCEQMATTHRARLNRIGNAATVRSNVFAIWITLKLEDTSANAGPPSYHRLFAVVDRSIPVGYSPGEDLNVRDAIRLRRFLE